jgi:hypothetical protein
LIGVALVALFIGIAVGASGKTKTVTHNKTVTRATTLTSATHATPAPRTVVRIRRVVPAPCKIAIATARHEALEARRGFVIAASWVKLVPQAAEAGYKQDAARITSIANAMKRGTTQLSSVTAVVAELALKFNANAARCD